MFGRTLAPPLVCLVQLVAQRIRPRPQNRARRFAEDSARGGYHTGQRDVYGLLDQKIALEGGVEL